MRAITDKRSRNRKHAPVTPRFPKEEFIIECPLTNCQKNLILSILQRNESLPNAGANLSNIANQLRKVFHHPFLISRAESAILNDMGLDERNPDQVMKGIINSSAKFIFLDKLMSKLINEGRKVLIFTLSLPLMNILEDFFSFYECAFIRFDNRKSFSEQQSRIDQFNKSQLPTVGLIKLTSNPLDIKADACILFDYQFPPENELSEGNSLKIEQIKVETIYNLVTKGTFETEISELVMMKQNSSTKQRELDVLMRKCAYYITSVNDTESFENMSIEEILNSSKKYEIKKQTKKDFRKPTNYLGKTTEDEISNNPRFWEDLFAQKKQKEKGENEKNIISIDSEHMQKNIQNQNKKEEKFEETEHPRDIPKAPDNSFISRIKWTPEERGKVLFFLRNFGLNRLDEGPKLIDLNKSVYELKIALRTMLSNIVYETRTQIDTSVVSAMLRVQFFQYS